MKCHDEVRAGLALLDDYYGDGRWVDEIDLWGLRLVSRRNCVLGQLFGDYCRGREFLRARALNQGRVLTVAERCAFLPGPGMTTTWLLAIHRRRKARRRQMTDALAA